MISLRSKITQKVLSFLFINESEEFYASYLAKELSLDRGNLIRKLHELEKTGFLKSENRGKERYYSLNIKFPFLEEYRSIINKTIGLEEQVRQALKSLDGIQKAFLFGSYVSNNMDQFSDIDLLVIGDHKSVALQRKIVKLQQDFHREINVISMSEKEFNSKKTKDFFLKKLIKSQKVQLI